MKHVNRHWTGGASQSVLLMASSTLTFWWAAAAIQRRRQVGCGLSFNAFAARVTFLYEACSNAKETTCTVQHHGVLSPNMSMSRQQDKSVKCGSFINSAQIFWHIWRFNMAIRGFPMLKNATFSQPAWIWTVEFQKSVQDYWSMYRKWSESASAGNWQQWHLVGSQHCPAFSRDICCEGIGPVGLLPWAFGWLGGARRAVGVH